MKAEPVSTGLDFTGSTLRLMQNLIDQWCLHPLFVQVAREVAEMAGAKDAENEAWAIWAWIRANVTYRADPIGAQWIQDPYETAFKSHAGNCANMAILAGTMLQALGHPAKATAVHWVDRDDWTHAVVYDEKAGRVVDPVSPTFEWPPQGKQVQYLVDADGHLGQGYSEAGRGLGFSIGGWHPFQIATYLPTLKKLDPLANTSIGKAVWNPIEKVNQTVNKDFAKTKVWSQNHRQDLQIAAAVAAAIVTAGAASGLIGAAEVGGEATAEGVAAAEGVEAGESVIATTAYIPETMTALTPLSASTVADLGALTPGVAATSAVEGTSLMSSVGSGLSTLASYGKDALTLLALSKALTGGGSQPGQSGQPGDPGYGSYSGGGYGSGGGLGLPGASTPDAGPGGLPLWALPVGGLVLLLILAR